jgi:hypothetical protein
MSMRRVGRADDAQAVLERVHAELESQMRDYPARSPGAYYELGAVLTLLGRTRAAVEALATASDGGWNDYYRALHDPRWDAARSEPLFESVMTNALDDLERQRAELAALETGGEPLAVVPRLTAARGTP